MNGKSALTSVSIWGSLVAAVVTIFSLFGIDISEDAAGLPERIAVVVDNLIVLAGVVVAIYGRVRAKKEITGVLTAKQP